MDFEIDHLRQLASAFRKALVAVVEHNAKAGVTGLPIRVFPDGACGEASKLLATYLREQKCGTFDYHFGQRRGKWHAWLARPELVVDITADQFDDQDAAVIVARRSLWHESFHDIRVCSAYFDHYHHCDRDRLQSFYDSIVLQIDA
jgi:hypothetical protein